MPFGKVQTIIIEADTDGVFRKTKFINGQLPPPKSNRQEGCNGFWSWLHDFFKSETINDNGRIFNPETCESNYEYEAVAPKAEIPKDYQGSVTEWDGIGDNGTGYMDYV